jgi:hypothetical protein
MHTSLHSLAVVLLLAGCSHSPRPTESLDADAIQSRIIGMSYLEARDRIVAEGWQPKITHLKGPFGPEREWLSAGYFLEKGYVEVQQCSGTGLDNCLFNFVRPSGECLQVATSGELASAAVTFVKSQCPE